MPISEELAHIVLEQIVELRARVDEIKVGLDTLTNRFDVLEGHLAQMHVSDTDR